MQCEGLSPETYSFFSLGTLEGPELAELQSHLREGCERCREEVRMSRSIWYQVALATPAVEPRKALRRRVIQSVRDSASAGFAGWRWQPVTGLAVLLLAVAGGWEAERRHRPAAVVTTVVKTVNVPVQDSVALRKLEQDNAALRARLDAANPARPAPLPKSVQDTRLIAELAQERERASTLEAELAQQKALVATAEGALEEANRKYTAAISQPRPDVSELQRQIVSLETRGKQLEHDLAEYKILLAAQRQRLERNVQYASFLADPNLKLVHLRTTDRGGSSQGHALIASGSQVVFYASRLPALPAGRAYQLWLIRASAPAIVSAGVFQPDARNRAVIQFNSSALTAGVTAVAVTEEPERGSPTPTGHKLLVGS
ncbi:MAG: anti-sigma factor [Acidobacteriota bacterium]|nr:anti-sigma factor [Acidobacteriota bacterium]